MDNIKMTLNTITHLDELISITKLNKDMKEQYLLASTTYEDIIKKYPFLKEEPLYAAKGISNFCYYWDGMYLFPIMLIVTANKETLDVEPRLFCLNDPENDYKRRVMLMKEAFDKGQGLMHINNDTLSFEYIERYINEISFEQFIDFYVSADYGFGAISKNIVHQMFDKNAQL